MTTHNNMMYPGIGVGGYCLTKDPLLAYWSNSEIFSNSYNLEHSKIGVKTNDKMPIYAFQFLKQNSEYININNKTAIILGVSYRSDVGDTWFVTFATEDDAKTALQAITGKTFNDKPVKGRLKQESLKKSLS